MNKGTHISVIHLHFFFLVLMSIALFSLHSQGCHDEERKALLSFKSALEDPSDRLSSWKDGNTYRNCCNWQGIGCSYDTFHVISINLRNTKLEKYMKSIEIKGFPVISATVTRDGINEPPPNTSLIGKFSPSLLKLTHLEYLDFAFNNFEIPFQLSTLTKLVHLDLSHSILSSSISTQFNNLSSLQYLDLSRHPLGVESFGDMQSTKWLRELTNLQVLKWSGVDLSSANNFGVHISYLSSLTYLDLGDCRIDSLGFLSQGLHNFSRLSTLIMHFNYLSVIPAQLANLTSLSTLDLSFCELKGSVPYLPQLKELDVSFNYNLRPDLTRMFQHQWHKLEKLSIPQTNTSGSIISLSNAPMLVSLSASGCSIQGSIHSSVSNLKHLQFFDVSYNNIQGSIPKSICEILSLRQLVLDGNNMTGTIPDCITKLHNLDIFIASGNSFGGTVSLINFMNGMNLTTLDLGSNRLTVIADQNFHLYSKFLQLESLVLKSCNISGLFPSFICELRYLKKLDLSRNNMTGPIPSCISKLKIASIFDLSNNKFSGPLNFPPQGSGYRFDLSHNNLSGALSIEIGEKLSRLNSIQLAGNELSGSIPFSICSKVSQSNPTFIDLSENKLSGIIPTSIGYCNNLYFLNLGSNNLSGNVPNELERASQLGFLLLHGNNLNGDPLNIISKLQYLQVLNLANNHFSGNIPTAFGSIKLLSVFSLRSNMFNGSIPRGILKLDQLQILDLSQNNFSGNIPKILGMCWRGFISNFSDFYSDYNIQLQMVINGIMVRFEKIYNYSSGIDLSHNMLDGSIPMEIGLLNKLPMLNLSHNYLSNDIPVGVGNMSSLGTLDLSFNRLSGHIPQSLTSLDFLGVLNLSYNEFSGRIPRGNHFDTLSVDGSAFFGNNLLCGVPWKMICDGDNVVDPSGTYNVEEGDQDDTEERILFFGIIALGFIVGFWGLFFVLFMEKDKLWFPYWRFIDSVVVKINHKLHLE